LRVTIRLKLINELKRFMVRKTIMPVILRNLRASNNNVDDNGRSIIHVICKAPMIDPPASYGLDELAMPGHNYRRMIDLNECARIRRP
jgi:hypothetical protein